MLHVKEGVVPRVQNFEANHYIRHWTEPHQHYGTERRISIFASQNWKEDGMGMNLKWGVVGTAHTSKWHLLKIRVIMGRDVFRDQILNKTETPFELRWAPTTPLHVLCHWNIYGIRSLHLGFPRTLTCAAKFQLSSQSSRNPATYVIHRDLLSSRSPLEDIELTVDLEKILKRMDGHSLPGLARGTKRREVEN